VNFWLKADRLGSARQEQRNHSRLIDCLPTPVRHLRKERRL
jgi:hypothetical protein